MSREDLVRALERAWAGGATFAVLQRALTEATGLAAYANEHFVLTTSGSTGKPRQVVLSKARAEALARTLTTAQSGDAVESVVLALPLHHAFALVNQWLWARVERRSLFVTEGFGQPDSLKRALAEAPQSMLCLVGSQVPLLERLFASDSFPRVARLHFAGGPFPAASLVALRRFFPRALITNNYGCTEAGPRLTVQSVEDAGDVDNVGRPLPGVELRADDAGALRFRSPYRCVALVDDGALRAVPDDEWLPTGDVGEMETDGTLRLTGRSHEVWKRHGEKVSLAEITAAVARVFPGQAACLREIDAAGEPGYVLVVAPAPEPSELSAILALFRERPRATWPLRIEATASIPLLDHGKVDGAALLACGRREVFRQRI